MANGNLYFGPYNDPGNSVTKHHWDTPHGPDCCNPALSVVRHDKNAIVNLAVRYTGSQPSPGDVVVTLYAFGRKALFNNLGEVDQYVQNMITHSAHTLVPPSPWQFQIVPARSSLTDNYWSPGAIAWHISPGNATLLVVVATVQSASLGQQPSMMVPPVPPPTQEACVGVWIGLG
jgi:hypothetical protein